MAWSIAIDGPVGAGKSSVADGVAEALGVLHLDTGAMYRAFAYQAIREGVSTEDEAALTALTQKALPEVAYQDGAQHTFIDGQDVTALIRTPEISMGASNVSKVAGVRAAMVKRQQALAAKQSMVLDGRDIGTRVLPNATLKIFLTASPETRAKRRYDEMLAKGEQADYDAVLADVIRRDKQDTTREVDPLRPAEDAQIIDSSYMTQEQVVSDIVRRLRMKQGKMPKPEEHITPMYRLARAVAWFLFSTFCPVRYHGIENAQLDAPFILIGNHQSMFDPLIAGWRCYRCQLHFLGKKELIANPILNWLFLKLLMIPVDRHNMDMTAVRECLKQLKQGHSLGIFPEGTRHMEGVMQHLESGIAMIALRSGAPLLPVYITGKPSLFKPIHAYFGQPIYMQPYVAKGINKETCDEVLQLITATYADMVSAHQNAVK